MSPEEAARRPSIYIVKFWTEFVSDRANPGEMKALDYVEWGKVGINGATTQERISRLEKGNGIEWQLIGPAYRQWQATKEIPLSGTPLAAWPGADHGLVEALAKINVRTVEDFVGAPSHAFKGVPIPDLLRRQKLGEDFLLAQGQVSIVAAELEKRDATIASQDAKIAEMQDQIKQMMAAAKPTGMPGSAKKAA